MLSLSVCLVAQTIQIDFDQSLRTQADWLSMNPSHAGIDGIWRIEAGDGVVVEVIPTGGVQIDMRDRFPNNLGGAESAMWNDFIFANGSLRPDQGMNIRLAGLPPQSLWDVQIWSYDTSSINPRRSVWNNVAYEFDGADPAPDSLDDYTIQLLVRADQDGHLTLSGRTADPAGPSHNVFINGLKISPVSLHPTKPQSIAFSSQWIYKSLSIGDPVALISTVDPEPDDTFSYTWLPVNEDPLNDYLGIQDSQIVIKKSFAEVPLGSRVQVWVRSTDSHGDSIDTRSFFQILQSPGSRLPIRINEIFTASDTDYTDGDGDPSDWIEIYNPDSEDLNLSGACPRWT